MPTVWALKRPGGAAFLRPFLPRHHRKARRKQDDGYIHSVESMGLVDGPRCARSGISPGLPPALPLLSQPRHPERAPAAGEDGTLVRRLLRFRSYFDRSGGGVTFSGGEPLAQPDFLLACLRRLKAEGVHTCLDTSGAGRGIYGEILAHTDLVLYDVKHHETAGYRKKSPAGSWTPPRLLWKRPPGGKRPHVGPPRGGPRPHRQPGASDFPQPIYRHPPPGGKGGTASLPHPGGSQVPNGLGIPYPLEGVPPMDKKYWNLGTGSSMKPAAGTQTTKKGMGAMSIDVNCTAWSGFRTGEWRHLVNVRNFFRKTTPPIRGG